MEQNDPEVFANATGQAHQLELAQQSVEVMNLAKISWRAEIEMAPRYQRMRTTYTNRPKPNNGENTSSTHTLQPESGEGLIKRGS